MANDINVQDMFLEKVKNERSVVAVYFEKIKMLGIVKDFDQFSITLDSNGQDQMIYKQGINYISLQKPKKFFKPRPGGFRPREAREGDSNEGHTPDGPRRPFTPRPRYDENRGSDNRGSDTRGLDNRGSDTRGDFRRDERRFDSQSERRYDSSQAPAPYRGNRDNSERTSEQSSDESKKVFRVQKPYPPKKS